MANHNPDRSLAAWAEAARARFDGTADYPLIDDGDIIESRAVFDI